MRWLNQKAMDGFFLVVFYELEVVKNTIVVFFTEGV